MLMTRTRKKRTVSEVMIMIYFCCLSDCIMIAFVSDYGEDVEIGNDDDDEEEEEDDDQIMMEYDEEGDGTFLGFPSQLRHVFFC